jgi:uncharacterized protein (TIGR02284 family)
VTDAGCAHDECVAHGLQIASCRREAQMADEQAKDDPVSRTGAASVAAPEDVSTLAELIQIAREGAEFYLGAADKVRNSRLRDLFHEMAAARARLVAELQSHVGAAATPATPPTSFGLNLRKLYVDLLARTADDSDRSYVAQLEEVEDGLLEATEDAVAEAHTPAIRQVLERHLPRVRANHDRVRAMKQSLH